MAAAAEPLPTARKSDAIQGTGTKPVPPAAADRRAMEATMARMLQAARDTAGDALAAAAATAYLLGFSAAVHAALGKLFY